MKTVEGLAIRVGTERPGWQVERRLAFERLSQPRLGRAYRLASLILGSQLDGQDAVHDAAVRAWTRWADLRDPSRFDAWFDRILINTCRDRIRQRRVRPLEALGVPLPERGVADSTERSAERDALRQGLAALDPERRLVVVLRYLEDLPVAEIARRTGEREGTVKSRLHYGLRELRAAYDAAERAAGGPR